MAAILLLPSFKWVTPFLEVPGHGMLKRPPKGQNVIVYSHRAAMWLIDHTYAYPVSGTTPLSEDSVSESSDNEFRQVVIRSDSTLGLEPPIVTSSPGNGENFLVRHFNQASVVEMTSIKNITQLVAEQLVAEREKAVLTWADVIRLLSDRQLQSALKWASGQVK